MSFISKWTRPEKSGFADRLIKTIRRPAALKPRIEQAQRKLQVQIIRLDGVSLKLREKDQALFNKIVSSVQQHDVEYSAILSNELSHIRKITKMVHQAKLALEQIHIRLNTLTELGDVIITLNPAMAVMKNVQTGLAGMMPQVDNNMDEISQLLSGILIDSGQVPNNFVNAHTCSADVDAQAILDEAASIVESHVKDKLPDLPLTGKKPLETRDEVLT